MFSRLFPLPFQQQNGGERIRKERSFQNQEKYTGNFFFSLKQATSQAVQRDKTKGDIGNKIRSNILQKKKKSMFRGRIIGYMLVVQVLAARQGPEHSFAAAISARSLLMVSRLAVKEAISSPDCPLNIINQG